MRLREVKSHTISHTAGRWPSWNAYPDVSESRFRGRSPSQKTEAPPNRAEHAFRRMQPGGSLWEGISLAGPPTMKPLRQRKSIRASLSFQGTPGQLGPTLLGWGNCQETQERRAPSPLHFVSRLPDHSHLTILSGIIRVSG